MIRRNPHCTAGRLLGAALALLLATPAVAQSIELPTAGTDAALANLVTVAGVPFGRVVLGLSGLPVGVSVVRRRANPTRCSVYQY